MDDRQLAEIRASCETRLSDTTPARLYLGEVRALLARLDLAEADARRYRWLRDIGSDTWLPFVSAWHMDANKCDAQVDAAIDQQRSGK